MEKEKKYYWIKLSNNFLTSRTVDFLMSQQNGSQYVVLYQMLCLLTINSNGELADLIGEVIIPFDERKIQRDTKYFSIDTVRIALTLFQKLGLIYFQENGILKISNYEKFVGCETQWAEKKRTYRENKKKQALLDRGQIEDNVRDEIRQDIRDKENRDKSKDIRDKDIREKKDKKDEKDKNDITASGLSKNPFILFLVYKNFIQEKDYVHIPLIEQIYDDLFKGYYPNSDEWKVRYQKVLIATKYMVTYADKQIDYIVSYIETSLNDSLSIDWDAKYKKSEDQWKEWEEFINSNPLLKESLEKNY